MTPMIFPYASAAPIVGAAVLVHGASKRPLFHGHLPHWLAMLRPQQRIDDTP
ncbi:MAG: hypothetical protein KA740_06870 [Rhodoferax sp.]|jgi:hypothetical protein|nr:hypothetical protein [Rhodoferax sp.]